MVVQEKKQKGEIRICVDQSKLNDACVHNPFPTPFTDEELDNVGGQEAHSFTNGFFGYIKLRLCQRIEAKQPSRRSGVAFSTSLCLLD